MGALSGQLQSLLTIKTVDQLAPNNDLAAYVQTVFDEGRANPLLAAVPVS